MTAHQPKTAALLAYRSDLLSPDAASILERHLEDCPVCRRELDAMEVFERVSGEVRKAGVPNVDWGRMELALRREATAEAARLRRRPVLGNMSMWGALAAAACVGIAPWAASRVNDAPAERASLAEFHWHEGELVAGAVTRVDGEAATGDRSGASMRAAVGAPLREGDVLETGSAGTLHATLRDGTGFALGASSRVVVRTLREGVVALELVSGTISNRVRPLEADDRYEIAAASFDVAVRGTHFRVTRAAQDAAVSVTEGAVAVRREGADLALVRAPLGRWGSSDALHAEPPDEVVMDPAEAVRPALASPAVEDEGSPFANGLMRLRVPRLSESDVSAVVAANSHRLRACFERAARRSPETVAVLRLPLVITATVEAQGGVRAVRGGATGELGACMQAVVSGFRFPAPGGPTTVRIPLDFSRR